MGNIFDTNRNSIRNWTGCILSWLVRQRDVLRYSCLRFSQYR